MKEKILLFMNSGAGRGMRIAAGLLILSLGMWVVESALGTVMTIAALIPIAAGLFDFCLAAGAMGYPLRGAEVREILSDR